VIGYEKRHLKKVLKRAVPGGRDDLPLGKHVRKLEKRYFKSEG